MMDFDEWLEASYSKAARSQSFAVCDLHSAFDAGSEHTIERVRAAIDNLQSGDAESLYAMLSGLE